MGFWDLLKNLNNAEGIRQAMKMSYDKHYRKAQSGELSAPETRPHQFGLYGALASRYVAALAPRHEVQIWGELAPFLALPEREGFKALAEYVVYKEKPREAHLSDLKRNVNAGIRLAKEGFRMMAAVAYLQGVEWSSLLDNDVKTILENSIPTDNNS